MGDSPAVEVIVKPKPSSALETGVLVKASPVCVGTFD